MIDPTIAAYAAGMIDGDGTIQVNKKKRKSSCDYYSISVSVSQVSDDVPNWLMRNFGGKVNKFIMSKERRQPVYRWSLYCNQASSFLQMILPYLVQKSERAKLAIKLQESISPVYAQVFPSKRIIPDSETLRSRIEIFDAMKSLNKKTGRNHWVSNLSNNSKEN